METKQITVHQGLSELKKISQRLNRELENSKLIGVKKNSNNTVFSTTTSKEDFSKNAISSLQSINDLIDNHQKIKSAIVISNAATLIKVGKKQMTVAQAIETKTSIAAKQNLLSIMKKQYAVCVKTVDTYNKTVEDNLENQLNSLIGSENNTNVNNLAGFMEEYRKQNSWEFIDPLNLELKIKALEEEIEDFESNVDIALSVSNATTIISI